MKIVLALTWNIAWLFGGFYVLDRFIGSDLNWWTYPMIIMLGVVTGCAIIGGFLVAALPTKE